MESRSGGTCKHVGGNPARAVTAKRLRRAMRAVYLVLVKKHQPKLAALGVHLHGMLSNRRGHRRGERSALTYLSCRSMDPAAAVVHPLPRDHGWGFRRKTTSSSGALSSLSCRSMDPASAVHQYSQYYRSREVQFSCKSTPPHKRRRAHHAAPELEYHGSAAAVTRLFELMDVEEEAGDDVHDIDLLDTEEASWPAPRQVRITDSPFPVMREEEDDRLVDRRADEFITWFHEQLRTQQQQQRGAGAYWVR